MAMPRIKTYALILPLCFLLLTSCGNKDSKTETAVNESAESSSVLSFRITWSDYSGRGQAITEIVDSYNKKNNGAVQLAGGDEDLSAIENLLKAGSDTVYVLPYRYVRYLGSKGYLTDLSDEFKDSEKLFYPGIWKLGTLDDKLYGIPWLGHSMCLLYNKNLLDASGVDGASINSLDKLTAALEKVEANTSARGFGLVGADSNDVSWMVNQFIYGFGGSLVNEDASSVVINTEKSKAALEYYRNILGEHAQPDWTEDTGQEVMSCFRNQEVAFEIQGIWGVTDIDKNGSPFEVGLIPMKNIGLCSEVGPMMLALPAGMDGEAKLEAVRFITYMISTEAQEAILKGEYSPEHETYYPFRTPIRIDMADSRIIKENPRFMVFIEGFGNPSIDVPVPAWQQIKDELYEPGLHKVMTGELAIDAFLKWIETEGNKVIKLY